MKGMKMRMKFSDFGRCLFCLKNPCQCLKCRECGKRLKQLGDGTTYCAFVHLHKDEEDL